MKKHTLTLCLLFCVAAFLHAASPQNPVIALGAILDVSSKNLLEDENVIALPSQVAAELVSSYDCFVVSRYRGYNFALEEQLQRISSIDQAILCGGTKAAPDHLIAVSYYPVQKGTAVRGVIKWMNMKERLGWRKRSGEVPFEASSVLEAHKAIAEGIAKALRLKVKVSENVSEESSDLTWAVLPFWDVDVNSAWETNRFLLADTHQLSAIAETTLHSGKLVKNLLDRQSLQSALKELGIHAIDASNESAGSAVGRLLGADRLLIGKVSKASNGMRLTMLAVDSKTSVIVGGRCEVGETSKDLIEVARRMTVEIAKSDKGQFSVTPATKAQRRQEADWHLASGRGEAKYVHISHWAANLASLEAAYMLMHDDPEYAYECGQRMTLVIEYSDPAQVCVGNSSWGIANRAATLVNEIMKPLEHGLRTRHPLYWRSYALKTLRRYEDAYEVATEHSRKHPGVNRVGTYRMRIKCCILTGKIDLAESLLKEFTKLDGWEPTEHRLVGLIAKARGDGRAEYEAMNKYWKKDYVFNWGAISHRVEEAWRFIDLWCRYEEPKAILASVDYRTNHDLKSYERHETPRTWALMVAKARALNSLGQREETARLCKDVLASTANAAWGSDVRPWRKAPRDRAKTLLGEIEGSIGEVKELWRTLGHVRTIPKGQSIYVVPCGEIDRDIVTNSIAIVSKMLDTKLKLLPTIPVESRDARLCEPKVLYKYALARSTVPDDALFVIFITGQLFLRVNRYGERERIYAEKSWNPILVSYGHDWGDESRGQHLASTALARYILWAFRNCYANKLTPDEHSEAECERTPGFVCTRFPCVFARGGAQRFFLRTSACIECQKEYAGADLTRMKQSMNRGE